MGISIVLFYFLFPALLLFLSTKHSIVNKIGVVVICYAAGLLIGLVNIIPESISGTQELLMGFSILVGIPLVLFSENILKWVKMAKNTFISLLLGVVSVVVLVIVGYFIFREKIPEIAKVSGMMIGVYTGGTANMAAIASSLGVEEELFILTNTVEIAVGFLTLLFLITAAKPLFSLFLRPYKSGEHKDLEKQSDMDISSFESYKGFFSRSALPDLSKAFGIALLIFGIGYGMSFLFQGDIRQTVPVLAVTTLGILASLIPAVNSNKKSFQLGMYWIYMFCLIIASKADIASLFNPESVGLLVNMFLFISLVIVGSLVLHGLLSWIFKVSVDEYIITSTALANSPPFVPVVAAAIRNKEVVIPGMIVGVVGYAIGNYLGVAIAYILK
jgi:uncharacterized membrane protein